MIKQPRLKIGSRSFPEPRPSKMPEQVFQQKEQSREGVMILAETVINTPAGPSLNFEILFSPLFDIRIKRITPSMIFQVAGAGVWARVSNVVQIENNVNYGVLYSTPGTLDSTGLVNEVLSTSKFFRIVNTTDQPYDCNLVLRKGTTYLFTIYSDFRAWGATDSAAAQINLDWEVV